jgi:hypothetical protein
MMDYPLIRFPFGKAQKHLSLVVALPAFLGKRLGTKLYIVNFDPASPHLLPGGLYNHCGPESSTGWIYLRSSVCSAGHGDDDRRQGFVDRLKHEHDHSPDSSPFPQNDVSMYHP